MGIALTLKKNPIRWSLTLIVAALTVFASISAVLSFNAKAAGPYDALDRDGKMKAYSYALAISLCYKSSDKVETNRDNVEDGQLFYSWGPDNTPLIVGFIPDVLNEVPGFGDDYTTGCGDENGLLSKKFFEAINVDELTFVCKMGYQRNEAGASCTGGKDRDFLGGGGIDKEDRVEKFKYALLMETGLNLDQVEEDVMYRYWQEYLYGGCLGSTELAPDAEGELRYEISEIVGGKEQKSVYSGGNKTSETAKNKGVGSTCQEILNNANNLFEAYKTAVQRDNAREKCIQLGYEDQITSGWPSYPYLTACINGALNPTVDGYCTDKYPDITFGGGPVDMQGVVEACEAGQQLEIGLENNDNIGGDLDEEEQTSCVIDGVGWIVCSMANFLASATDGIYSIIENMIRVPAINTNVEDRGNGVYNAWTIMRDFSNVVFVIVFLIIIVSQLTGLGVTNYGVKKMLPRLIVAAILVNVSFWIAAIAVDVSNILGAGIYDILSDVKNRMSIGISSNWGSIIVALLGGQMLAITGGAVVGIAAVGTAAVAATGPSGVLAIVFLVLPLLLGAILAVLVLIFLLIARQALIIILLILSPLAFVAMILPNTEKLFTRWRQTLTSLLLMYPIVSLIFGGAQVAGLSILASASGSDPILGGISIIMGQAVMVLPFFFLPMIITKFSGGNLDNLASNITNRGKKLIGGVSGASRKFGMRNLGRSFGIMKGGYKGRTGGGRLSRFARGAGSVAGALGNELDMIGATGSAMDKYLKKEEAERFRKRLGTDKALATRIAGGDAAEGEILASKAVAQAEAEDLKEAMTPLMRQLASMRPELRNAHLSGEVAAGGSRAAAALHYAAQTANTGFLGQYMDPGNSNYAKATGGLSPERMEEISRYANEAVSANSGAIKGKAPHLVKGADAAFSSFGGGDMAQWDANASRAFMDKFADWDKQIEAAHAAGNAADVERITKMRDGAIASLGASIADIKNDSGLQSTFNREAGEMLVKMTGAGGAMVPPEVVAHIRGGVGTDHKIRPDPPSTPPTP